MPGERVVHFGLAEVKAETLTYLESLALEVAGDDGAVVVVRRAKCAGGGRGVRRRWRARRLPAAASSAASFDLPDTAPRAAAGGARLHYLPFALR
ncbi:MAG: hypothetical protein U1F43_33765 [Myxococcota bacterium]